jgi:thiol-disulfide isomerase/thioredoxin
MTLDLKHYKTLYYFKNKCDVLPSIRETMMNDKLLMDIGRKLRERADIAKVIFTDDDIYYDIANCFYNWCLQELPVFERWSDENKKHFKKRMERRIRYFNVLTEGLSLSYYKTPQKELCQKMFVKAVIANKAIKEKMKEPNFMSAQIKDIPDIVATILSFQAEDYHVS